MGKEIIRNKYHGHIVEQVLNGDGWDTKLFSVDADGKESFLQECESLGEAIGIAKQRNIAAGNAVPAKHPPATTPAGESIEVESPAGVTVEIETEK